MGAATAKDYYIDTFLTRVVHGYRPQGMISEMVFPVVSVSKPSGVVPIVDRAPWLRQDDTKRAPATKYKEGTFTVSSVTFNCKNYAFAHLTPKEVLESASEPHKPSTQAAQFVIDRLMLDFEKRVADVVVSNVGTSTTLTGTDAWSDFANSDPLTNIEAKYNALKDNTGYAPNVAVIGRKSWQLTRRHPDIVKAASGLGTAGVGGMVTPESFAKVIGVERVLIPSAIINTAKEGQSASYADVWSASAFVLMYVAPSPGIMVPSYGYAFRWEVPGISKGAPGSFQIERKYDDDIHAEYVRSAYYQDETIIDSTLGAMIHTGIS